MAATAKDSGMTVPAALSELEVETIEIFVRLARLLGIARSIGEIYGLLFVSAHPVPFDCFLAKLGISSGSASQGLRVLRSIGAVKTSYIAGDRRNHYVVETGLRKIVSGLLRERIEPHLADGEERLAHLSDLLTELPIGDRELLEDRLRTLRSWREQARTVLPVVMTTLASN